MGFSSAFKGLKEKHGDGKCCSVYFRIFRDGADKFLNVH
jgi:hypothetical protein